jgi:hypothetical protein
MKKALAVALSMLFSLFLTPACTADEADYVKGTLTETRFESEYLNLRFTLPEDYILATEEDMISMMNLGADFIDMDEKILDYAMVTTVYEMMASSPIGLPNVIVMAEKLTLSNMTEEQYIEALKNQLSRLKNLTYTVHGELASIKIAGQQYKKLSVKTTINGVAVMQDYSIRKSGNRIIAVITTYTEETIADLDKLMSGFTSYGE